MKQTYGFFTLARRAVGEYFKAGTKWAVTDVSVSILHGASWALSVVASQYFYDAVAGAATGGLLSRALWGLAFVGIVTVIQQGLNGFGNFLGGQNGNRVRAHIYEGIIDKAARVDPACYEDPAMLDGINKAKEGGDGLNNMSWMINSIWTFYLPYLLLLTAYLYAKKPLLALMVPIAFVPVLFTQIIRTRVFAALEDKAAPVRRKYEYYEKAIRDRDYFRETRLFGAFALIRNLYAEALGLFGALTWKAEKRTTGWEILMRLFTLCGYMGILALLVYCLVRGEITVGLFAAVFSEIAMLFGMLDEVITRNFSQLSKQLGSVRNYAAFMDAPERPASGACPSDGSIRLENASFRYPGAKEDAVHDVSLTIRDGETVAIVGENGAGKTTLVRLMTGLYLPTSGNVQLGGVNTRDSGGRDLFAGVSAVFQKFMKYRLTLGENIAISDTSLGAPPETAIRQAGFDAGEKSFPDGLYTVLSKEFGGVDLSGGQWQRVAIARGLYRAHRVIMLDEPTSAIDPLEETRVYQEFAEIARDCTAVIVTHRLGSARIADRIIVLDEGRIIEEGSHDALMKKGGKYAEMVAAQAGWYERDGQFSEAN